MLLQSNKLDICFWQASGVEGPAEIVLRATGCLQHMLRTVLTDVKHVSEVLNTCLGDDHSHLGRVRRDKALTELRKSKELSTILFDKSYFRIVGLLSATQGVGRPPEKVPSQLEMIGGDVEQESNDDSISVQWDVSDEYQDSLDIREWDLQNQKLDSTKRAKWQVSDHWNKRNPQLQGDAPQFSSYKQGNSGQYGSVGAMPVEQYKSCANGWTSPAQKDILQNPDARFSHQWQNVQRGWNHPSYYGAAGNLIPQNKPRFGAKPILKHNRTRRAKANASAASSLTCPALSGYSMWNGRMHSFHMPCNLAHRASFHF